VTLTFDFLLVSSLCPQLHRSCKIGELLTSGFYDIEFTNFRCGHLDSPKTVPLAATCRQRHENRDSFTVMLMIQLARLFTATYWYRQTLTLYIGKLVKYEELFYRSFQA